MTGSEGLLGVVTEVTVRILKKPETARALLIGFPTSEQGGQCVADIIGAGIIPGGMEMMDRPAIHAAEDFVHAGYPLDVEALLIVELDGPPAEVDDLIARVETIARANGSTTCRVSSSEAERSRSGRAGRPLSGRRAHLAGLLLHGRNYSPKRAAQGACRHAPPFRAIWLGCRQCLSRRRRQFAPADPL
jgi:FAD/FMN-containing dehydrogenase